MDWGSHQDGDALSYEEVVKAGRTYQHTYSPIKFPSFSIFSFSVDIPRIMFMGPRRSGKSSIERVVFHKMSPHETLFLESTNQLDVKLIANNRSASFYSLFLYLL